jgi:DNA topoisomerase-1
MVAAACGETVSSDVPSGLIWTDDSEPGMRRRRAGKGFTYLTAAGRRVTDEKTLARIRALAIPPAWTDVWICPDASGHLQATGRDARGRKQYRYHTGYRAHREAVKFERLFEFGSALPAVRRQIASDIRARGMPKEKVVATVIRLLESTMVRVGNEEYARDNGSYGLTTLRDKHAKFSSTTVRLMFTGKHGIAADVTVRDPRLRRIVKQCQDLPGQVLFQYVDDDGVARPITSTDVNDYLRTITGLDVTAKDFRTWMGTLLATAALAALDPPHSETASRRAIVRVCETVGSHLGNTPTVCRSSYIHPSILEWYRDGTLGERWEAASSRGSARLVPEERKLLALLRPRRTSAARRAVRAAA